MTKKGTTMAGMGKKMAGYPKQTKVGQVSKGIKAPPKGKKK